MVLCLCGEMSVISEGCDACPHTSVERCEYMTFTNNNPPLCCRQKLTRTCIRGVERTAVRSFPPPLAVS
jgi:hypothetical protein